MAAPQNFDAADSESGSEHDSDYECDAWKLYHRLKQERKRRARMEDARQVLKSEKAEAEEVIEELTKAKSNVDRQVKELVQGVIQAMSLNDMHDMRTLVVKSIEAQGISLQGRLPCASEDITMQDRETEQADTNVVDMQKTYHSDLQIRKKCEGASFPEGKDVVQAKHATMKK